MSVEKMALNYMCVEFHNCIPYGFLENTPKLDKNNVAETGLKTVTGLCFLVRCWTSEETECSTEVVWPSLGILAR
jgi:hypothetical protein